MPEISRFLGIVIAMYYNELYLRGIMPNSCILIHWSKTMFLFDVTRVQALPNRNLDLTFENGFHGIVEMDRIVKNYTGVFAPLLQDDYFRQVTINTELGTVVWPNGADLCPDVLYSQATGIKISL